MARKPAQLDMFGGPPAKVGHAAARPADEAVAARLTPASLGGEVRLGTSSWSFPGWAGLVFDRQHPEALLSREGLVAYAAHPLLRAVGVDRSFYAPVGAELLASYAAQVPASFRFLVKAHEACTLARFPKHARYGANGGKENPLFLDAAYATDRVVGPFQEGLGAKGGVLLFQLPPQGLRSLGGAARFAERLELFLGALPAGPRYAVEVRTPGLLGPAYVAALAAHGAAHCYSVHPTLPPLPEQARLVPPAAQPILVVRWMLHAGLTYDSGVERYEPFSAIVDEDPVSRGGLASLVRAAARLGQESLVIVNNKAEGCAVESVARLAAAIASEA